MDVIIAFGMFSSSGLHMADDIIQNTTNSQLFILYRCKMSSTDGEKTRNRNISFYRIFPKTLAVEWNEMTSHSHLVYEHSR